MSQQIENVSTSASAERAILLTCDCDDHSDKCALGRVRALATANYNRCCMSIPSAFGKSLANAVTVTAGVAP